ncbi:uncharacterized protein EV420DRAFT_287146 [Desarmillaria tabescens]|uniref:Uncharacterized protein n=1 Tax=Armillaria tabescens TaxID=1929756 RepID=A0AA39KEL5_ARMTA|nr:uncharacterized protein EV420DRAFT_287146 [Desarmillaria tabescens]KAK0459742.1 hypothetical protein EV420DRAFT_287146 [Desarmillaria tabescens]
MPSPTRDPRRRPSTDSMGSTRRESNARRSPSPVLGPSSRPERRARDSRVTDNSSWAKSAPPSATSSSFPPPISATSTSFVSPPPPPPPSTNVVQPPPPPPPGPTVLDPIPPPPDHPTLGLKQPKYELSTEEKRKIWEQRLNHWVAWNKMRASIMVLEERVKVTQNLIDSLPPSNSVASCSKELERLKQELSDHHARFKHHFNKIVETDSWPMAPRPEQGVIENKYADMVKLVDTVTKNVSELNISINKTREDQFGPEETTTISSRKRRRLSDGGLDDSTFNAAELREGIDAVESQLLDLQNLLLNHDNDIQAEVIALMENRYEELETARNAGTDPEAQFRQMSSIRLHTVEQQLGEVAVEMADVMTKAAGRDADQDEVKRENCCFTR